jgi:hypothetical protein
MRGAALLVLLAAAAVAQRGAVVHELPKRLRSRSTGRRAEIRIQTGKEHGAFFRPREEWVAPVLAWVRQGR